MRTLALLLTVLCAVNASATEWDVLGPRALAMGGAGVAIPQGAESAYWNPAALGLADNPSGLQVPVGGHLGITGTVLQGANDLNQLNKSCQAGDLTNCNQSNVNNALNELNNANNGVRGDVGGGLGLKFGRFSMFANNFAYVGAKPIIDMTHVTAIGGGANNIQNNTSALRLSGIDVTEIGLAYGHALPFMPAVDAGVALKGMIGKVGFYDMGVIGTQANNGGFSNFTKNASSSFAPGVDIGAMWDLNRSFESVPFRPRIGITARNINNPKFKTPAAAQAAGMSNKYSIQGNTRVGIAFTPLGFWNIAADADLTKNLTAVEGVKQQNIGAGTEINVFNRSWINIPLRAGLTKNIADGGAKTALTGGFGLNFLHFNVDVGAAVTPGRQQVQSYGQNKKLPNDVSISGQFALLFGGGASALEEEIANSKQKSVKEQVKGK